jgi:hypothetical protein
VNDELESNWKETVEQNFKVLPWLSSGRSEENYENSVRIAGLRAGDDDISLHKQMDKTEAIYPASVLLICEH